MTRTVINLNEKPIANWADVQSGDFVKLFHRNGCHVVHVDIDKMVTIIPLNPTVDDSYWLSKKITGLPKLEKIYSKAEITLHD